VQVVLDRTARDLESSTPTDAVDISEQRETDETKRGRPSGEPGVKPNVGVVAGGGQLNESSLRESSKVEKAVGTTRKVERTPPGEIKEIFAAINVSHTYLEGVYRRNNPNAAGPTVDQIQTVFETEKTKIENQVTVLVKPQDVDHVRVDWYYDAIEAGVVAEAGALETSFDTLRRFGPVAGLALLALFSLGLVMRMARRSDAGESFGLEIGLPQDAIAAAKKAAADIEEAARRPRRAAVGRAAVTAGAAGEAGEALAAVSVPTGEAAVVEGVLDGQEVDEGAVQVAHMLGQVTSMAEQDPEGIATLVERWAQRKA
jgi:flagellar biosynthesis/type III secretory pathway M-ring protein FliF/YscJ